MELPNTPRKTLKKLSLFYNHSKSSLDPEQASLHFDSDDSSQPTLFLKQAVPLKDSADDNLMGNEKSAFDNLMGNEKSAFEEDDEMTGVDLESSIPLVLQDRKKTENASNMNQKNQNEESDFQKLISEYRQGTFLRPEPQSHVDETLLDESDELYATLLDYTFLLKKKMKDIGEKERELELKRVEFMEQVSRSQAEYRTQMHELKELERRLESQIETEKILQQKKEELERKSSLLDHEIALLTLDIKEKNKLYMNMNWYQYVAMGIVVSLLLQVLMKTLVFT